MATVLDHDEQEHLEALRAWWARYSGPILIVLIALMLGIAGYNGWRWYQRHQTAEAAVRYDALLRAAAAKDMKQVDDLSGEIIEQYAGSGFAPLAALLAARVHFDAGDMNNARAKLQWALEHANPSEYRGMARLRLASVAVEQKAYDEAHKLLATDVPAPMAALAAELNGDIYVLQGMKTEARAAYHSAQSAAGTDDPALRERLQKKLDDLGAA
jgi:predicted negative regulator of RcsB-dependent stress response